MRHDPSPEAPSPRRSPVPRPLGLAALGLALCLVWSFALAVPAQALAGMARAAAPRDAVNVLALLLSRARPLMPHTAPLVSDDEAAGGASYPWQAGSGGANLTNGNKLISLPLVAWTARGGLPVALTLSHNSQGAAGAEIGPKWSETYDVSLGSPAAGRMAVTWGDGSGYTFTLTGGAYAPPAGIHDTLTQNADGTYTLTKPNQTHYHFTSGLCDAVGDENGNTVTVARNADGTVSAVTDPTGRALTLGYSGGRLSTVTDPLGRTWTLTYTGGLLTSVAYPPVNGTAPSIGYGYNGDNDITGVTDLRGNTRSLGYNADDSLAWEQDNAGSRTTYAYSGMTSTVTDPNGHATVYTYDGSGRVVQEQDAAGYSAYITWDGSNNKTQVEDRRGHYWHYTYDGDGNRLTAEDPLSHTTTFTYNGHHRPLTQTLPGGESRAYTYDGSDNLTQTQQKDASGTVLATTAYTVGASTYGLVTAKEDANSHTTSYGYDTNGNLASTTTPLGNETQWGHDALGVKTSRTDSQSQTTAYALDGWERLTTTTYPDGSAHTFSYDAGSDLTGFTDGTGATARTYDVDGRMLAESKNGSTVVSHAYDAAGELGLLSSTTDSGGRTITYAYTGRDQLSTVSEAAGTTTYAYDAAGEQAGITNGNGTTVTDAYDDAGRLASVTNKSPSGSTLSSFSYAYNGDDRRTGVTEADGSQVAYGYDGLLHLSSEVRTGTNAYSAYYYVDGVGNRVGQYLDGAYTGFSHDADDELVGRSYNDANGSPISYTYYGNQNGDRTEVEVDSMIYNTDEGGEYSDYTGLSYDYDDQLTHAGGASFAYDALGRQVSRTAGGVMTAYQYDGDQILLEKQGSTTTAAYTYGNALVREGGATPLFDGLGSARTLTGSGGAATASSTTTAFGQPVAGYTGAYGFGATSGYRSDGDGSSVAIDSGGGEYSDGDGLLKVGARYYDPGTGSFLTRDTDLSQSPYAYCDGDPVNATDPSGHIARGIGLIVRAIAMLANLAETNFEKEVGPVDQLPQYDPDPAGPYPRPPGIVAQGAGPGPNPPPLGGGAAAAEAGEGYEIAGTFFVDSATLAEIGEVAVVVIIL